MGVIPASGYLAQLRALLPRGSAWARQAGSILSALLEAFAQELARFDARAHQLLEEVDPRTASEMLAEWERVLGLPDPCSPVTTSVEARRLACWRKLAFQGGQTPAFYIAMAAAMGLEIEIHEFDPDVDDYDASLAAEVAAGRWRYIWRVHVLNAGSFSVLRVGGRAGDRLRDGDAAVDLECIFTHAKPAHTHVIFTYPEA